MKVRWRVLKRPRDWPPSEELVLVTIERGWAARQVTAAYWTEELANWSFLEWYPEAVAVAWTKMPDPFKS